MIYWHSLHDFLSKEGIRLEFWQVTQVVPVVAINKQFEQPLIIYEQTAQNLLSKLTKYGEVQNVQFALVELTGTHV